MLTSHNNQDSHQKKIIHTMLQIADKQFNSRLFTGTGKFSSSKIMEDALLASESELITVALKRVDVKDKQDDILSHLKHPNIHLLPNTSGVRDVNEAIFCSTIIKRSFGNQLD